MLILYDFAKIPQSNASHSTAPFTREPLSQGLSLRYDVEFNFDINR